MRDIHLWNINAEERNIFHILMEEDDIPIESGYRAKIILHKDAEDKQLLKLERLLIVMTIT
jgi:hypothetical protein